MRTEGPHTAATALLLLLVGGLVWLAAASFNEQHIPEKIYPSASLTRVLRMSDFNPLLLGTPADTDVYLMGGMQPGGSLLVLGGSHATEIAGVITAILLVESLDIQAGRVFIVPRANASAATHTTCGEAHPASIEISTPAGPRRFRYGARLTNPVHQAPDPALYRYPGTPRAQPGLEARNLNRVYPGKADGTLTERVAWAITELIRSQEIDLAFDLHEAPPERRLVNAIVASETSIDIASEAVIDLQIDGLEYHLESSSSEFRGLSHREWTDAAGTRPILMETANPLQSRFRGRATADQATVGLDARLAAAARGGYLAPGCDVAGFRLETRIGRNLAALAAILRAYNAQADSNSLLMCGWPDPERLQNEGLGNFLGH